MEFRVAIQIEDNFLEKKDFKVIENLICSDEFPWFFNKKVLKKFSEDNILNYQFTHNFFKNHMISSNAYNILLPLIDKIKPKAIIRIKANLNVASKDLIKYDIHKDQEFDCKGAIYYVNTNNGYTLFQNEKVQSKENRIVFFKANSFHGGTNCTDVENRILINFNYL